jgi:hypothetical protein
MAPLSLAARLDDVDDLLRQHRIDSDGNECAIGGHFARLSKGKN